jgi:probable addiction module antidote protein
MSPLETTRWDAADHLASAEAAAAYLEAAIEDGDSSLIAAVLDDVARAEARR